VLLFTGGGGSRNKRRWEADEPALAASASLVGGDISTCSSPVETARRGDQDRDRDRDRDRDSTRCGGRLGWESWDLGWPMGMKIDRIGTGVRVRQWAGLERLRLDCFIAWCY
jgi:hypothetical protein